jgi:hypothetical protein
VGVVEKRSGMRITRILVVVAALAIVAVPAAMAFGFDDSVNPPDGVVGTPYNFQFKGRNGCPPYSYSIQSGGPPPGLSMDSGGTVSGTPTTAGSFSFWAQMDDACGSFPAQRPFTIDIAPKLTVSSGSPLPVATVGVAYSVKLTAEGGGSQTWSVSDGTLPQGLALGPDGTLSGTAAAATSAPVSFQVRVTDGARTDTKTLGLDVVTPLAVTAPTFAAAEVGQTLKPATVTATGGRAPYAWSLVGAPAWVVIDPASGAITGTPDTAGVSTFQAAVKDVYGATATLDLNVAVRSKVAVKTVRLSPTKVGKLFTATLRTVGGVGPFTWKVTSGRFPVGIRLDRKAGVVSGAARTAGTFPLNFTVTDSLGQTSATKLTLTVNSIKKPKKK